MSANLMHEKLATGNVTASSAEVCTGIGGILWWTLEFWLCDVGSAMVELEFELCDVVCDGVFIDVLFAERKLRDISGVCVMACDGMSDTLTLPWPDLHSTRDRMHRRLQNDLPSPEKTCSKQLE